MAAVFQDFVHYQFTAAENIGLGDVTAMEDRARIEQASRRGGAHQVISDLPHRYETVLGRWFDSGQELSQGQWQKLAVSRAFMRDAELVILDEPTASIDAEAEHELFERFKASEPSSIMVIVSHRFSAVRVADRIAVFHAGRIVELGTHHELLEQDGRYAHLFRLHARGFVDST